MGCGSPSLRSLPSFSDRRGRNRNVLPFASIASMSPELVALGSVNFGQPATPLRERRGHVVPSNFESNFSPVSRTQWITSEDQHG
jgi:hypothetical protein